MCNLLNSAFTVHKRMSFSSTVKCKGLHVVNIPALQIHSLYHNPFASWCACCIVFTGSQLIIDDVMHDERLWATLAHL